MFNAKIQTPISRELLAKARKRSEEMGFSSINEVIRILLKLFSEKKIDFGVSGRFDENGLEYVSDEEQKEIEAILKRNKRLGLDKIVKSKMMKL